MANLWPQALDLQFLEHYQRERVIWDTKHPHYKHRRKVLDAWERLSDQMSMPIEVLKKKKDSLMATYRGNLRKMEASQLSVNSPDDVYQPIWFAFELMHSFLKGTSEINHAVNTETQNSTSSILEEELEESTPSQPRTRAQEATRKKKNPPELLEVEKTVKESFSILNRALQKKKEAAEEDECDLYGKLLAKRLRKLPEDQRGIAMHTIDGMILKLTYNWAENPVIHDCTLSKFLE